MDPLSLLAGIAGVATAGIQISKAIYELVSTIHGTPKEVSDIARGVSDLSNILGELRRALKEGRKLYSRKLVRRVSSAIKRIGHIHAQIREMIDGLEGFAALKWLFRRSRIKHLLYQIESHKNGINIILHIMTLAVQTRALHVRMADFSKEPHDSEDQDEKAETELLRQSAENLVRVSYQSLRNALDGQNIHAERDETDQADGAAPDLEGTQSNQLQLRKEDSERDNNTTEWLYELIFSSYAESLSTPGTKSKDDDEDDDTTTAGPEQPAATDAVSTSRELMPAASSRSEQMQLAVVMGKPVKVSSVVDELLAEWTNLTEEEIAGTVEAGAGSSKAVVPPIKFKDAVGRTFTFPFHLVQKWIGMEELIKAAFLHVDVIGPHVQEGHYDLIGPTGEIILPPVWEYTIQPGDHIRMHMWPTDKAPLRHPVRPPSYPPHILPPHLIPRTPGASPRIPGGSTMTVPPGAVGAK